MGHTASRDRKSGENEAESASQDPSHEKEDAREETQEETERVSPLADVRRTASVDAANDTPEDADTERVESTSANTVSFASGPSQKTLAQRYEMPVGEREATTIHRLESEHGREQVQRWANEGMPVETMGKPRDMAAFRQRQEQRSDAIPVDIERQNGQSLQRSVEAAAENGPAGEAGVPDVVRKVISKPGQSLPEDVQGEMESKLGEDFSDVQIHTGSEAAAAADVLNARAFTIGNHIVFNEGEYQPEADKGKEILAHELTHVRQQNGDVSALSAGAGMEVDPDPQQEKEAEQVGKQVRNENGSTVQREGANVHLQLLPADSTSFALQRDTEDPESSEDANPTESTERVADVNSRAKAVSNGVFISRMAANASIGSAGGEPSFLVQREAATEGEASDDGSSGASSDIEEDDGDNVADYHTVTEGDTLTEIAAANGLEDWRNLWYMNFEEIGDEPHIIFPNQTLAIPEDENAVPDPGVDEPEGEALPAPTKDTREEKSESTPVDAPVEGTVEPEAGDEEIDEEAAEHAAAASESDSESQEEGGITGVGVDPSHLQDSIPETAADVASSPTEDPALQESVQNVTAEMEGVTEAEVTGDGNEPRGGDLADTAQAAAEKPEEESDGEAETEHLEVIDQQQSNVPDFDKSAFKETINTKIEEVTPETIEEVDGFGDGDELDDLEEDLEAEVQAEADDVEQPVSEEIDEDTPETDTDEEAAELDEPEPSAEVQSEEELGDATSPDRRSREEVEDSFDERTAEVDEELSEVGMNQEDLASADQDEWARTGQDAGEYQDTVEGTATEYRQSEGELIERAEDESGARLNRELNEFNDARGGALHEIAQDERETKQADEDVRANLFSRLNEVYLETRLDVQDRLEAMEEDVQVILTDNVAAVREEFESDVEKAKEDSTGFASWLKRVNPFTDDDLNENFEKARQNFVSNMKSEVVDEAADTVAEAMSDVGEIISDGEKRVNEILEEVPEERQDLAQEAAAEMDQKFSALQADVEDRTDAVATDVVDTYEENLNEVEDELGEAKEEVEEERLDWKPGFVETIEEIKEVGELLIETGEMIGETLAMTDLKDIDLTGELLPTINASLVEGGEEFGANIGGHLGRGFIEWVNLDTPEEVVETPSGDRGRGVAYLHGTSVDRQPVAGQEGSKRADVDLHVPDDFTDFGELTKLGGSVFRSFFIGGYLRNIAREAWGSAEISVEGETIDLVDTTFHIINGGDLNEDDVDDSNKKQELNIVDNILDVINDIASFVIAVVQDGVSGAMDEIWTLLEHGMSFGGMLFDMVIDWLMIKLIENGMTHLAALTNPVGKIVKAAIKIYEFVSFLAGNAMKFAELFRGIVGMVIDLIKGKTQKAASVFEGILAGMIVPAMDLLATVTGLSDAPEQIQEKFGSLGEKVDDLLQSKLESAEEPVSKAVSAYYSFYLTRQKQRSSDDQDRDPETTSEYYEREWSSDVSDDIDEFMDGDLHDTIDDASDWGDDVEFDSSQQNIENALDLVRQVDDGGDLSESQANRVLNATGLEDLVVDEDLEPIEFVHTYAEDIKEALEEKLD